MEPKLDTEEEKKRLKKRLSKKFKPTPLSLQRKETPSQNEINKDSRNHLNTTLVESDAKLMDILVKEIEIKGSNNVGMFNADGFIEITGLESQL